MTHVVFYSGGIGSWAAAKRVAAQYNPRDLILLFTDTKSEHPDTYRFLRESAANVGGQLVEIADGRTIWEVFEDTHFLGNARVDPCSRILKRELADRWLREHFVYTEVTCYVGIDWTEVNRFERMAPRKLPYIFKAPLLTSPYLSKQQMHEWAAQEGLRKQVLYELGAAHANCGGGCIKMGQGGFAHLLQTLPDTFREWEEQEERLRAQLGNVAILRDRRGGTSRPLPLRELRERLACGREVDKFEIGGCGCFLDEGEMEKEKRRS